MARKKRRKGVSHPQTVRQTKPSVTRKAAQQERQRHVNYYNPGTQPRPRRLD